MAESPPSLAVGSGLGRTLKYSPGQHNRSLKGRVTSKYEATACGSLAYHKNTVETSKQPGNVKGQNHYATLRQCSVLQKCFYFSSYYQSFILEISFLLAPYNNFSIFEFFT